MKTLCIVSLIASLALNGLLAGYVKEAWNRRRLAEDGVASARSEATPRNALPVDNATDESGVRSLAASTYVKDPALSDSYALVEKMKADGYPDAAIRGAWTGEFNGRNNGEFPRLLARQAEERNAARLRGENTTQGLNLPLAEVYKHYNKELEAIAGVDADERAFGAREDAFRYGGLSVEKIAAIKRIENVAQGLPPEGGDGMSLFGGQGAVMPNLTQFESQIRQVLDPAEAEDYFRYNGRVTGTPANFLQGILRLADVSQADYLTLLDEASKLARATPEIALKPAMLARIREVIGDNEYVKMIPTLDTQGGGRRDRYFAALQLPATARIAIFEELVRFDSTPRGTSEQRAALVQQTRETLTRIGNLTAEQLDGFAATMEGLGLRSRSNSP